MFLCALRRNDSICGPTRGADLLTAAVEAAAAAAAVVTPAVAAASIVPARVTHAAVECFRSLRGYVVTATGTEAG
jgi:hypothetical protein